jgi:hypothetical protein
MNIVDVFLLWQVQMKNNNLGSTIGKIQLKLY